MTISCGKQGVHCCLQIVLTIPEKCAAKGIENKTTVYINMKKKQGVHYGMDIRPEPEKCRGPLHMAGPHCRLTKETKMLGHVQKFVAMRGLPVLQ